MISYIDKENSDILDGTFIDREYIENELVNNPFAKIMILQEDNKIIGYLYFSDIYDRAELNQIEIEESNRNCGKGDFILKKFIEVVDKNITLEVRMDNLPAIKIYEKNGFVRKAIRKGYYNGIDGILMEREKK